MMTNHIIDQDACNLILRPVSVDEIPVMPESKSHGDVDDSICPDNYHNAMAANMAFIEGELQ